MTFFTGSQVRRTAIMAAALTAAAAGGLLAAGSAAAAQVAAASAPSLAASTAATDISSQTFTLPAGVTVAHIGTGAVHATIVKPDTTITCTLAVQNPHNSTHVPGTVNVVSTIKCTSAVSYLDMNVGLYLEGVHVASGSNDASDTASLQANAATNCVSGSWSGGATGAVTYPAGYTPSTSDFGGTEVFSPSVDITC
jgi:hypothetical protein